MSGQSEARIFWSQHKVFTIGLVLFAQHFLTYLVCDIIQMFVDGWNVFVMLDLVAKAVGVAGVCLLVFSPTRFVWHGTILCLFTASISIFWIWRAEKTVGLTNFTVTHSFGVCCLLGAMIILFFNQPLFLYGHVQRYMTLLVIFAAFFFLLSDVSINNKTSWSLSLFFKFFGDLCLGVAGLCWIGAQAENMEEIIPLIAKQARSGDHQDPPPIFKNVVPSYPERKETPVYVSSGSSYANLTPSDRRPISPSYQHDGIRNFRTSEFAEA